MVTVFQQTFIEQPHLPGRRVDTVPALMVLDPNRSPVERPGVGGWDSGRYKGRKKFSLSRGQTCEEWWPESVMPSQLTRTKISLPRVYATIPSSVHSLTKMYECLLLVGSLGVWARLGRGMEAEQGVGVGPRLQEDGGQCL